MDTTASARPMSARRGELMKAAMIRMDPEEPKPIREQQIRVRLLA